MVGVAVGAVGEALGLFEGLTDGVSVTIVQTGSPAFALLHISNDVLL
jgi:hypothetical protein